MSLFSNKAETLYPTPWRKMHRPSFDETAQYLEGELKKYRDTRLNIVLIGPLGSGKSALINSISSIAQKRIANRTLEKPVHLPGIGTRHFLEFEEKSSDLFHNIHFYDTMGFHSRMSYDDLAISEADLKAVFEGRISKGHEFNKDSVRTEPVKEDKPHCVIFVISAGVIEFSSHESGLLQNLKNLPSVVPHDVAKIAVITKIDHKCDDTARDIQRIYSSKKVHQLVQKAEEMLGMQQNEIFPIVNFVKQVEFDSKSSVPILYALQYAISFALDRKQQNKDHE